MEESSIRMSLVVAINEADRGIGYKGKLPWSLPQDLRHFKYITTSTADSSKINAVVMGRLTWNSIPKQMRPLPNRLNVIISTTLNNLNDCDLYENADSEKIVLSRSFEEAIQLLLTKYEKKIETIHVIGGTGIFKEALKYPAGFLHKIYLTRVFSNQVKCDVFLEPANFLDGFEKLTELKDHFDTPFNTFLIENNIRYIFEVYQKVTNKK